MDYTLTGIKEKRATGTMSIKDASFTDILKVMVKVMQRNEHLDKMALCQGERGLVAWIGRQKQGLFFQMCPDLGAKALVVLLREAIIPKKLSLKRSPIELAIYRQFLNDQRPGSEVSLPVLELSDSFYTGELKPTLNDLINDDFEDMGRELADILRQVNKPGR